MSKRYDEPIDVTYAHGDDDAPVAFRWRDRRYEVHQRLESWRDAGEWWNGVGSDVRARRAGGGPVRDRVYVRVLAHPAARGATGDVDADALLRSATAVYDIYLDRVHGVWRLARIWD